MGPRWYSCEDRGTLRKNGVLVMHRDISTSETTKKEEDSPIERDLRIIRKLLSLITIKIRQVEDKIRCGNV